MAVPYCHVCNRDPLEHERFGDTGLPEGSFCPVCHRPTCVHHLVTVRWRWRDAARQTDSAKVCRHCQKTFNHRNWDPIHREWIT